MSSYTDALSAFIAAREAYEAAAQQGARPSRKMADETRDSTAQALAQAGDVLERELRQMMREEVKQASLPATWRERHHGTD